MKLVVDIGNTRCKWALAAHGKLHETGVMDRVDDPDWVERLPGAQAGAIVAASVAQPGALEALRGYAVRRGIGLHVARSSARCGALSNAYSEPERLGVDRWMACIAAQAEGADSVLVADAGTALTLDFVDRLIDGQARHCGGLITPGVATMRGALRRETQLRPSGDQVAATWLCRDTDSAIASGTLRSLVSLLDAAVRDLAPARLLLTGGDAGLLAPYLADAWQQRPYLVMEGLALYAARGTG